MSHDMFDETFRYLDQMQSFTYSMPVLPDKDGYIDKECHKANCLSMFKVYADDWENLFKDEAVYCPFCGHGAPSNEWWTTEQLEQAKKQAVDKFNAGLNKALKEDARNFNRGQRNGFIKMTLTVKGKDTYISFPARAMKEMEQKIQCEQCGARYAIVGSAYYCPCCGSNSAKQTFQNNIEMVNAKIKYIPEIKTTVSESSRDDAERICTSLLETCVSDLVVSLQNLCECVYPSLPGAVALKKNVFQRLPEAETLWKNICGYGYKDWLSASEYSLLIKCFQQRHVLQHKNGIVDQEYIDKSGDQAYLVGQHLRIREPDVIDYFAVIQKVGSAILNLQ